MNKIVNPWELMTEQLLKSNKNLNGVSQPLPNQIKYDKSNKKIVINPWKLMK